ncbi:MAG: DUF3000 family protein [Pseudonocardiaceae bacterium]|nr:DUF3000 family protein [Pseudonocardiaceae bacterium]
MTDTWEGPPPPEVFRRAVSTLGRVQPRPEVRLERIRPPQRLAPFSHALAGRIDDGDRELVTARLVLLHDPDGQDSWDGVLRVVAYLRAELETEVAGDPLLPGVGWSWLTEALHAAGAGCTALGGTVTQTSSARFGDIAGPERTDDVELRASWTPLGEDLLPHAEAFCELIAVAAGLPPVGVAPLVQRNS